MNKKILIIIIGVIILVGIAYFMFGLANKTKPIACTQEAKICPDGSSVGRTGSNCEFASCPISIVGWKTFTDDKQGITVQYPEKLPTSFMNAVEWPPKIVITNAPWSCLEGSSASNLMGQIKKVVISNNVYCVEATSEGAAGSIYVTYTYTTKKSGQLIAANFIVQYPQCANYDDPQQTQCKNEQSTFDLAGTIDRIIQSVKSFPVK